MSFIRKAVKSIVNFVKDHWVKIAVVAAVVFSAGVATIGGWTAFQSAAASTNFISAIGSTMWAGVTGTAGSMGIGSGAQGAAAASAGVTGQGLGAGLGWGSQGLGLGVSTAEYGSNLAGLAAKEGGLSNAALLNAQKAGLTTSVEGAPLVLDTAKVAAVGGNTSALTGATPGAAGELGAGAAGEGMTMGKAMLWSTAIQTGAGMAQGYYQGAQYEASLPKSIWLVPTDGGAGPTLDQMPGYQPGPAALAAPGPNLGQAVSGAEAGALASVQQRPYAPLMTGAPTGPIQPGVPQAGQRSPLMRPINPALLGGVG